MRMRNLTHEEAHQPIVVKTTQGAFLKHIGATLCDVDKLLILYTDRNVPITIWVDGTKFEIEKVD